MFFFCTSYDATPSDYVSVIVTDNGTVSWRRLKVKITSVLHCYQVNHICTEFYKIAFLNKFAHCRRGIVGMQSLSY